MDTFDTELTKFPGEDVDEIGEGRGEEGAREGPDVTGRVRVGAARRAVLPRGPLVVLLPPGKRPQQQQQQQQQQ